MITSGGNRNPMKPDCGDGPRRGWRRIGTVCSTSPSTDATDPRSTAAVLGKSPLDFVQEVRLDQATFLLRTTDLTASAVAAAVGYQNVSTLRSLVRRRRRVTLNALRTT